MGQAERPADCYQQGNVCEKLVLDRRSLLNSDINDRVVTWD